MLPTSPFARALRNAAPRLSRRLFPCRHRQPSTTQLPHTSARKPLSSINAKINASWRSRRAASTLSPAHVVQPPFSQAYKTSSFPDSSSNAVAYWLLGSAASVFGIVVFGGWTRLSESGYLDPSLVPLDRMLTLHKQSQYNRMEACHRVPPTSFRCRLDF